MTGGMAPIPAAFAGSDRLHPDGRPKGAFRDELRRVDDARNGLAVAATIASPIAVVAAALALAHPVAWVAAFLVMPVVQNRLFILHHEAAHRTLFSNRRLNDLVGINLVGWLTFGTGGHGYRIGHIHHHREEFGPKEPDFLLYSQYPITSASMRRKHRRDLTGVSAFRIVRPRFQRLGEVRHRRLTYRFLAGQALVLGAFWASGHPWLYLLLWVLPWASLYQGLNRLRAIAEHGGMTRPQRPTGSAGPDVDGAVRGRLPPGPPRRHDGPVSQPGAPARRSGGGRVRGRPGVADLPVAVAGPEVTRRREPGGADRRLTPGPAGGIG